MCAKDSKKTPKNATKNLLQKPWNQIRRVVLQGPQEKNVAKTPCMFLLSICDHRLHHIQSHSSKLHCPRQGLQTRCHNSISLSLFLTLLSLSLSLFCLCSCCRSATSVHSIALFKLHYNRNGLQTRCYNSLSLSVSLSLLVSVFALDRSTTTAHWIALF